MEDTITTHFHWWKLMLYYWSSRVISSEDMSATEDQTATLHLSLLDLCSVTTLRLGNKISVPKMAASNTNLLRPENSAQDLGFEASKKKEEKKDFNGNAQKLNVTLASNAEGWDKMVNGELENELIHNDRIKLTGFVPHHTHEQRQHARELNIELFDSKSISGYSSTELLAHPPDDLRIDILMMHSYGHDVGRQAPVIKEAKKCLWVIVAHTISEELEKYLEKTPSNATVQESEHDLQVELCRQADLVIAIGPKVAEAYKAALRYCGKQDKVVTLVPGISENYLGFRQFLHPEPCDAGEKFRVLISGSAKYFKVKGCDIAAQTIKQLRNPSYHLILAVLPHDDTSALNHAMQREGISLNQLTVTKCSGALETWRQLLCKVDLLIKPSRTEGFGMSGLRAISADLPVLISGNCGLGIVLKELPSGRNFVVDSEDPQVWAEKIKEIRAKESKTRRLEAGKLKKEYLKQFQWKVQCDGLVDTFFAMTQQGHAMALN